MCSLPRHFGLYLDVAVLVPPFLGQDRRLHFVLPVHAGACQADHGGADAVVPARVAVHDRQLNAAPKHKHTAQQSARPRD